MDMFVQIVYCASIRINDLLHILRPNPVLHPCTSTRYEPLRVELIGIKQISTEGLCIIRFIADVRQYEYSGLPAQLQ
jgi:hypothetical protein